MDKVSNILVYHIGQLGDTLVALPAIQNIKYKHPNSHIVLLTDKHVKENITSSWDVIKPLDWIDEVVFYSPDGIKNNNFRSLIQSLALVRKLRPYHFKHIYNLALRLDNRSVQRDRYFLHYCVGAKYYHSLAALNYNVVFENSPVLEARWSSLLNLTDKISDSNIKQNFRLAVPTEAEVEVDAIFDIGLQDSGTPIIAMAPGSKMQAKRWSEKRFSQLGKCLIDAFPTVTIVIVGGKEDFLLGERLCATWNGKGKNLTGKLSIYGSAKFISRCLLFIGNDTGTMHLAAMVGVRCICIFSARDYRGLWEPYGDKHTILRKHVSCAGCMLDSCIEREKRCLALISVDEVFNAVSLVLQKQLKRKVRK